MNRARLGKMGLLFARVGVVLAVIGATGNYVGFGNLRYDRFVNPHDVYHYYIGAKYSPEHRYGDLYRATVLAQEDAGFGQLPPHVRNLDTHDMETFEEVQAQRARVRARYTDERWASLQRDLKVFNERVPKSKWFKMVRDKGYNPTPVWNLIGRAIAEAVPIDNSWGLNVLASFDIALIGGMGVATALALGWEAGLLLIAFIGLNFFGSFVHIKGAFLRLDWLAALVGAVLLMRSKKGMLAGLLVGYAAMVRVFPVLFVGGPLLLVLERLVRKEPVPRELRRFLYGTAVAALLLFLITLPFNGVELWTAFAAKMSVHSGDLSSTRVGLLYIAVVPESARNTFNIARSYKLWVAVPMLLVWLASVRRLPPAGALAWGVIPVFLLTEATFYYYVMLAVVGVWLLPRRGDRKGDGSLTLVAAGLLLTFVLGYFRATSLALGFQLFRELSIVLAGIFGLFLLATLLGPNRVSSILSWIGRALRRWPHPRLAIALIVLLTFSLGIRQTPIWRVVHQPLADLRANTDERELVFVGDVMMSRNVARSLTRNHRNPFYVFEDTAHLIQDADFAFANLECPVSERGEAIDKRYVFNADPNVVPALEQAGFDLVSLANNHTLDFGTLALDDTLKHLDASPIDHVGLSHGNAPQEPHIVDLDGIKVGTLAYCDPVPGYSCATEFDAFEHGPAKVSKSVLERDIHALRARVDIVVVSMHWGREYKLRPGGRQTRLARTLVDLGVDIIAGHHPHVQQDADWVGDGLAIYSMGNFVFDQARPNTQDSRIYRVVVGKEGVRRASYLPLYIQRDSWQPQPTEDDFVPVPSLSRLLQTELDLW